MRSRSIAVASCAAHASVSSAAVPRPRARRAAPPRRMVEHDRPVDEEEGCIRRLGRRGRRRRRAVRRARTRTSRTSRGRRRRRHRDGRHRRTGRRDASSSAQPLEHGCLEHRSRDGRARPVGMRPRHGAGGRVSRDEFAAAVPGGDDADSRRGIRSAVEPDDERRIEEHRAEDGFGVAPRRQAAGSHATRASPQPRTRRRWRGRPTGHPSRARGVAAPRLSISAVPGDP